MAPLAALPLVGGAISSLMANPRNTAKIALQFAVVVGAGSWFVYGLNGRAIAGKVEAGEDRTFDCAAFDFSGGPGAVAADDPSSDSGATSGGNGQDIMTSATKEAGVPESWATSDDLWKLLQAESSSTRKKLNPTSQNPTSSAYGIFQFLDQTWASTGIKKTSDPQKQSIAGLKYIKARYGSPTKAWNYHQQHNSY